MVLKNSACVQLYKALLLSDDCGEKMVENIVDVLQGKLEIKQRASK